MIINFHFNNGASGFHLDGEADDDGNPLVVYVRKQYPVLEEFETDRCFIKIKGQRLYVEGSTDRIRGKYVRLHWRSIGEHELAEESAALILREYPDTDLISFGAHKGILFTEDKDGFRVVKPNSAEFYKGSLEEVRQFIEDIY